MRPSPAMICVACRRLDASSSWHMTALSNTPSGRVCPGCGTTYPSVDGAQVLLGPVDRVDDPLGAFQPAFLADVPGRCASLATTSPADPAFREASLLGTFARAHLNAVDLGHDDTLASSRRHRHELVVRWMVRHQAEGPLVEWGAGPGGQACCWREAGCGPVVLADVRMSMARVAAAVQQRGEVQVPWRGLARRFEPLTVTDHGAPGQPAQVVCADALDPPFEAEVFETVVALNLLDTVPQPWVLLGQLDAQLAPGGLLLLGMAYHYDPAIQDPAGWLDGPTALRDCLTGDAPALPHLDYEILEEELAVPWLLPAHERLTHRYDVHLVMGRKRA